jgi:hypothetical protein
VTAEVASSSLVVPAISFQRVTGRDTGNSDPQLKPLLFLVHHSAHPHSAQEFDLRGTCFVAVFLRVRIEFALRKIVEKEIERSNATVPGDDKIGSRRKLVVCRECQIPIEPVRHHPNSSGGKRG